MASGFVSPHILPPGAPARGFTLLEVLVSLAVLSIALVVLLGLRNRDVNLVQTTRYLTEATALANMKMAEANAEGFPGLGEGGGKFEEEYAGFQWYRVVSPTPFDYVREVRISVSWGPGAQEGVELVNYVFEER